MLGQPGVDVLVCGEAAEWETTEYARDAVHLGLAKALIVVGHANSEEAGMLRQHLHNSGVMGKFPHGAV